MSQKQPLEARRGERETDRQKETGEGGDVWLKLKCL